MDCTTCRHHSKQMRPKPQEALGFDALFSVSDEDEPFFVCRAPAGPRAGQDVGFEPVTCSSHETATPAPVSFATTMRAWEERMRTRA